MIGPQPYAHPPGRISIPARDFDCDGYDRCLRIADGMASWTCLGCPRYQGQDHHEIIGDAVADDVEDDLFGPASPGSWLDTNDSDIDHVCVDCGRAGDARTVRLMDGLPRCVLCRPDMGLPRIEALAQRIPPWVTGDGPMLSISTVHRLCRCTPNTARKHVYRSARYPINGAVVLVPARLLGLAAVNPIEAAAGDHIGIGLVADWLGMHTTDAEAVLALMGGEETVHWLDLAHRLIDHLVVGDPHA